VISVLTRPALAALLIVAVVFGMAVSACGGDDGRSDASAAVESTIQAAGAALAAGDVEGFVARWTDEGMRQVFDETTRTFPEGSGYYVRAKQWTLGPAAQTRVAGTRATTVAVLSFRLVGAPRRFSLVNEGGAWKIDGAELTTVDVPDARSVEVAVGTFPMALDASSIGDGDIALNVRNATGDIHELDIMTVPRSKDVASFFAHPELEAALPEGRSMPDGMDFIGGISRIAPGATVTILFGHALPPGRYVLFCNVEDAPGQPHAQLGEYTEFTVE
jgi:hypothetical protein